jgi:hypothetical protein
MKGSRLFRVLAVIIFTASALLNLSGAAGKQTFTGEVGDAMCGRNHMPGEPADACTRACVAHGSKYALIVGDKIYTLDTSDKAALDTLDKQAGKKVTVVGTLQDDVLTVASVSAR